VPRGDVGESHSPDAAAMAAKHESGCRAAKRIRMSDDDELLEYARRYFAAAAQSVERRKMQLLVSLGLDYLKLAARREQTRGRRRKEAKGASRERKSRAAQGATGELANLRDGEPGGGVARSGREA